MDVSWIKLSTDLFDNRKIKHLRKLPEGNNILLIWIFLLTLAGRCNAGGMIFLTENIPYSVDMLADECGFENSTVTLALEALERFGMISRSPALMISDWEEHQNIDGLEKIREQERIRKANQRARQKQLAAPAEKEDMSRDSHGTITGHVTGCHATDIDKEKDIDITDIDTDKDNNSNTNILHNTSPIDSTDKGVVGGEDAAPAPQGGLTDPDKPKKKPMDWNGLIKSALKFGDTARANRYYLLAKQQGITVDVEKLKAEAAKELAEEAERKPKIL